MPATETTPFQYYKRIAERLLPWLEGRRVLVRGTAGMLQEVSSGEGPEVERPTGIATASELVRLAEAGAGSFFVQPASLGGVHWAVIELQGRGVPLEGVRLAALKTALVLRDAEVDAMICYDGGAGFHFLWRYAFTDPGDMPWTWENLHRKLVRRMRMLAEARLAESPERDRIGHWSGYDGDVMVAIERGAAIPRDRVALTAVPPDGFFRAPLSLHEGTRRVAVPLTQSYLYRFDPERHAGAKTVMRMRTRHELPMNFPDAVLEGLGLDREGGTTR